MNFGFVNHDRRRSYSVEALERRQLLAVDMFAADSGNDNAGADDFAVAAIESHDQWTFVETFDGDPASPSSDLLPDRFDYAVTHRTHSKEHFTKEFEPFPADHDSNCAGPNPDVSPLPQHLVTTINSSNGTHPDESFFICKNHFMSSMGHVEGYSISSFWPRQEFNFANGGVLEFDVNINVNHPRVWWEVVIAPRDQMRINAANTNTPISEIYSPDHIVLDFSPSSKRLIQVGADVEGADGVLVRSRDWRDWGYSHPDDPALEDRRIRRSMRIEFEQDTIDWKIKDQNGEWDSYQTSIPGGLPFDQGVVIFKTHAYTPEKDENFDTYTFHWDNLRFNGPDLGVYPIYEATDTIYLQANGSRPIGERASTTITLPETMGANPVLFGQSHNGMPGQVLVSINDGPLQEISVSGDAPYGREGWRAFQLPLESAQLVGGENQITFEIGPRPEDAVAWAWGRILNQGFGNSNCSADTKLRLRRVV